MARKKAGKVEATERTWGDIFKTAVITASEDPEAFVKNAKGVAVRLGAAAEGVYEKIQQDPDFVMRESRNKTIQKAADALRKKFGF